MGVQTVVVCRETPASSGQNNFEQPLSGRDGGEEGGCRDVLGGRESVLKRMLLRIQ